MQRRPPRQVPAETLVEENISVGLDLNSEADNYLNWISDLCIPYLGRRILEVGAGHGDFTNIFREVGDVTATELSIGSLTRLSQRFLSDPKVTVSTLNLSDDPTETFDSVVLINVLEHIYDDEKALRGIFSRVRPGGHVVLYVPAFWLLYSSFDNDIGHHRRYRKSELVAIAKAAGFELVRSRYVNMLGAVGWFVLCRVLRRRASESLSVGLMNSVVIPVMRKVEDRVAPPFGVSIFYVGRRPTDKEANQKDYAKE